ncbi:ArgE/DapE family deacylase [Lacticaseibacillus zeae]|uniref:Probable succinyl-diaminopimelate desuccinylase n=1 Tax=Lacticaseibacillus zeae TaxID=57037 RepID=A0A5R8LKN3_LACZE|nr:ArgE/DapE family deacylase [Lacticaseibacillus zeae]TLF37781.1 ArgE/DapE family deacylase [Lacticaseibacillus zeae]
MTDPVALLQKLIRIDSANGHELAVAKVLQAEFEAAGIPTKLIPYKDDRVNLVAELNQDDQVLGFTGHQDVVSPGNESAWTYPPFSGKIVNNVMYGRGTDDMKSGLAAMTLALIALKQAGFKHHIRFMATVGEEFGAMGARQLTEQGYADDLAGLIVGEPTDKLLQYAHGGTVNYEIDSEGVSVHSSRPEKGVNAIDGLVAFAEREPTAFDQAPDDPDLGVFRHSITVINGGDQVNTIPAHAYLRGNLRPTPAANIDLVVDLLKQLVERANQATSAKLTLKVLHRFLPVHSDKNGHLVTTANQAIAAVTGTPAKLAVAYGGTDASEFIRSDNHFDVIVYGPGDNHFSHQIDEHVDLDSYTTAIKTYQEIAKRFFA